jgi:alcohol dehydrogenase class IV
MMRDLEFTTAARIVFGPGSVRQLPIAVRQFGNRPLLVTGSRPQSVLDELEPVHFLVSGEPTVDQARAGARIARDKGCDVVVALGGGSAIDAGKAIAALAANPGDVLDYLEVVGRGQALTAAPLPFIAVPTTAGTGSEVTRNAVLASPEHKVKASLRSPLMIPRLAVIDPELALSLPRNVTAATGLDALTQLIEPYVSIKANPMTDGICLEGIARASRSFERACTHPADIEARTDMAFASLCGGFALANAGLGAVHGFAAPIGGMFPAPHGAVCAILLPHVIEANFEHARARYKTIGGILGADPIAWTRALVERLEIPRLRAYGITEADIPGLVAKAQQASSMKANPVVLPPETLARILRAAL